MELTCARAEAAGISSDIYDETDDCEIALNYGRIRIGCLCDECMKCEWKDDSRTEWQDTWEEALEQWEEMMAEYKSSDNRDLEK